jgi:hypothetical protein
MKRMLFIGIIVVLVMPSLLSKTNAAGKNLPEWIYEEVFDRETGVILYLSAGVVNTLIIAKPNVAFENLKDKELKLANGQFGDIYRYIDREHGVVLYYHCSGFAWWSCGVGAVKLK